MHILQTGLPVSLLLLGLCLVVLAHVAERGRQANEHAAQRTLDAVDETTAATKERAA